MITYFHWLYVRLVDLYDYMYLLVIVSYCICRYVMVCWIDVVPLCGKGQDTLGGTDRLWAL